MPLTSLGLPLPPEYLIQMTALLAIDLSSGWIIKKCTLCIGIKVKANVNLIKRRNDKTTKQWKWRNNKIIYDGMIKQTNNKKTKQNKIK